MAAREDLIRLIRLREKRMHASAGFDIPKAWLKADVTMSQVKILFHLARGGPLRMGALARLLGVRMPTATEIAGRLVANGHAVRGHDPADRRSVVLDLTPRGRKLIGELSNDTGERMEKMMKVMTRGELEILLRSFEVMAAAAMRLGKHPA